MKEAGPEKNIDLGDMKDRQPFGICNKYGFPAVENGMVIELKSTAGSETSLALKTLK